MSAILLLPAALCPVHPDHINILKIAYKHLKKQGYIVSKAYLLPSSEGYVRDKTKDHFLTSLEHRVKLAQIAVKDIDWIEVLDWGMASGNKARKILSKQNPNSKVFIVAGSDTDRDQKKDPLLIVVQRDWHALSSTQVRKSIDDDDWEQVEQLVGEDICKEIIAIKNAKE